VIHARTGYPDEAVDIVERVDAEDLSQDLEVFLVLSTPISAL